MISKGQAPARHRALREAPQRLPPLRAQRPGAVPAVRAHEELGQTEEPWRSWTGWSATFPGPDISMKCSSGVRILLCAHALPGCRDPMRHRECRCRFSFYELALYKLGWTFYKQDSMKMPAAVHCVNGPQSVRDTTSNRPRTNRNESDGRHLRVISLSYFHLGGANSVRGILLAPREA